MLITSTILPKYKDNIIGSAETLIHQLGAKLEALVAKETKEKIVVEDTKMEDLENQALKLSKKSSSVQEVEEVVK